MPTSFSSTTSRAKLFFSFSSVIALPPYLMTIVLPWKRWMYGSASARIFALSAAVVPVRAMDGALDAVCALFYEKKRQARDPPLFLLRASNGGCRPFDARS